MNKFGPNQRDFISEVFISYITYILDFGYDLTIEGYTSRGNLLEGIIKGYNCVPHSFVTISVVIRIS